MPETPSTLPPHRWRSPLLGEACDLDLPSGRLQCFRRGAGPTLVFAHGWLANANLWRRVVDALAGRFECVTLDLPLGSHRQPIGPAADLSADGVGALILDALVALGRERVTLVGNDSGGAYSQIAAASAHARVDGVAPELVAGLVLNSCETPYDEFPPAPFDGLPAAASSPARLGTLLAALRDPAVRRSPAAYGWLIKHPIDDTAFDAYVLPALEDPAILADTARAMAGASTAAVRAAGRRLIAERRVSVLFAWSPEDRVFPIAHAERYAAELADARVVPIADAYSFTPEDQPAALAAAIGEFAAALSSRDGTPGDRVRRR